MKKTEQGQKAQEKIVLLLQPARLLYRHPVVQLLKVSKTGKGMEMEEMPLMNATISLYLKHLPAEARKGLVLLSKFEIERELETVPFRFSHQRTEKDESVFRDRVMARYYMDAIGQVNRFGGDITWYHRVPDAASGKMLTAPCHFHRFPANLFFKAMIENGVPVMEIWVEKGQEHFPLSDFKRFYFLLQKKHEYLSLPVRCWEALDWLENQKFNRKKQRPEEFLLSLADELSGRGFKVRADGLHQEEVLQVPPVGRVVLNELNNAFLMLTPQFLYDGKVLEGPYEPVTRTDVNGKKIAIHRDETAEKALVDFLVALHPKFKDQHNGFYYLSFAEAQKKAWFLGVYHQLLDADIELVGIDMLRHFKYAPFKPETRWEVLELDGNWVKVNFQLSFGKEKISTGYLQKMLLNGQKAVLLKDGSLGVLGEEWLDVYAGIVKHSRLKGKELWVPKWLAFSESGETSNDSVTFRKTIPESWWENWRKWQTSDAPLYPLPKRLTVESFRDYQQKGYEWLRLLAEVGGSACLADEMGLGKTLQTISFLVWRLEQHPAARFLVVCPTSLIYNWQQEMEKFAPGVKIMVYHGPARRPADLEDESVSMIITSFGTLRQDGEKFENLVFDCMVLDESHHIKNPSAQITQVAVRQNATMRIALSGTPVMNGTFDLYSQLHFLMPGLLGNREFFRREYALPIEQQKDEVKAQVLQKLIAPFILRRTKEQVAADLPEKTESISWCSMGPAQRRVYENLKEQVRSNVMFEIEKNGLEKGKISVLAGLTKLRMICNSAALVPAEDDPCTESIKTDILIQELQKIAGHHKALVFSQFTSMLDLLENDLAGAGLRYYRIDGSTAASRRQEQVNRFQEANDSTDLFLLSLKAGNAGINLTAAEYVFLFDPWWNAAVENQAIDRTHRIGQYKNVFAYRLICKDTVEERILQLKNRKTQISASLITTDDGILQHLSEDDIRFLFR